MTWLRYLDVAHGEAKVRGLLHAMDCFTEVWRGRWQLGGVAGPVTRMLAQQASASESMTAKLTD